MSRALTVLLFILSLGLLLWSFQYGLEHRDEALYLYNLIHGPDAQAFYAGHRLLHILGGLFDHHLYGYRVMTLALLLSGGLAWSAAFDLAARRGSGWWCMVRPGLLPSVILSIAFLNYLPPTPSYNTLVVVAWQWLIGACLMSWFAASRMTRSVSALLVVGALVAVALSRPPALLPALMVVCALAGCRARSSAWTHAAGLLALSGLGLVGAWYTLGLAEAVGFAREMATNSHQPLALLRRTVTSIGQHALLRVLPVLMVGTLLQVLMLHAAASGRTRRVDILRTTGWFLACGWLLYPLLGGEPGAVAALHLQALLTALVLAQAITGASAWWPSLGIVALTHALCWAPGMGTNNPLPWWGACNMLVWTLCLAWWWRHRCAHNMDAGLTERPPGWLAPVLAAWLFAVLLVGQVTRPFDPFDRLGPTRAITTVPQLRGIHLPVHEVEHYEALQEAARQTGLNPDTDVMLPPYDQPIIPVVLGMRAWGSAWLHLGYEGVDEYHVNLLRRDRLEPDRRIYLMAPNEHLPGLRAWLIHNLEVPDSAMDPAMDTPFVGPFQIRTDKHP